MFTQDIPFVAASKGIFPFLGAFAKLQKPRVSFIISVCPHGTAWLSLDGF
jgi:hypothetical protein